MSGTIEFLVNSDNFVYNENYDKFINKIAPYVYDNLKDVEYILIIGSASPEGNVNHNTILANLRANKIYSYFSDYVSADKIIVNNDYNLFLNKTHSIESEYDRLRAVYIEVHLKTIVLQRDTLYITKTVNDTLYLQSTCKERLTLSIYNNFIDDLLIKNNIGLELYFWKMSFFIERSDKEWYSGFRRYINNWFLEAYGNMNSDSLFGGGFGLGYKFNMKHYWKVYPLIRFGYFEYYKNQGNINISFNNYIEWKSNQQTYDTINKGTYNKVGNFGPTYIGFIIQKDLYITIKK